MQDNEEAETNTYKGQRDNKGIKKIPPGIIMSVCRFCVSSGGGLCDGADPSSRVVPLTVVYHCV